MVVGTLHCSILVGTLKPREGVRQGPRYRVREGSQKVGRMGGGRHRGPCLAPCMAPIAPCLLTVVGTLNCSISVRIVKSRQGARQGGQIWGQTGAEVEGPLMVVWILNCSVPTKLLQFKVSTNITGPPISLFVLLPVSFPLNACCLMVVGMLHWGPL